MDVIRAHFLMVCSGVMLRKIIGEVFEARGPLDVKSSKVALVDDPKVVHVHGTRLLFFDGVVSDAKCSGVVYKNISWFLWAPHLVKGKT